MTTSYSASLSVNFRIWYSWAHNTYWNIFSRWFSTWSPQGSCYTNCESKMVPLPDRNSGPSTLDQYLKRSINTNFRLQNQNIIDIFCTLPIHTLAQDILNIFLTWLEPFVRNHPSKEKNGCKTDAQTTQSIFYFLDILGYGIYSLSGISDILQNLVFHFTLNKIIFHHYVITTSSNWFFDIQSTPNKRNTIIDKKWTYSVIAVR